MTTLIGLFDSDALATSIAKKTGMEKMALDLHRFPDGEWRVRLPGTPAQEVILVCSLHQPNEKTIALFLLCSLLREMGVTHITLIAPYLAYMRQDIAFHPGEGVSARYFARLISGMVDRLVTIDPHLHRIPALDNVYSIPCLTLHAAPVLGAWLREHLPTAALIGPDAESAQWVSEVAGSAGLPFTVLSKERLGDREVRIAVPAIASWQGRPVVLVDDMISTGRTLMAVATQLRAQGVANIRALCVHALHDEDAASRMVASGIGTVLSCNTVVHGSNAIDITDLLVSAMKTA